MEAPEAERSWLSGVCDYREAAEELRARTRSGEEEAILLVEVDSLI